MSIKDRQETGIKNYWGGQTRNALDNFNIGSNSFPEEMIKAYAIVKMASARANRELQLLPSTKAGLIITVCEEIINGKLAGNFPLTVWISGSGTQLNMNLNEVIAHRAMELNRQQTGTDVNIHPNDDVNMSQSTNDTFPSAMNIAVVQKTIFSLIPTLTKMKNEFANKAKKWKEIIKVGRTHLQDATPISLGQEFSGYETMINENISLINYALKELYRLPLGGTAVGTGINTLSGYDSIVVEQIKQITDLPFVCSNNKFAHQGAHNSLVNFSGALKTLAVSLGKIADDIRFLSCGPRCGIGELSPPRNEPGSSIMPGKVNPTRCEVLSMIAIQVTANDLAVTLGGAGGQLEMNAYKPLIIYNIFHSLNLLSDGVQNFTEFLLKGLKPGLRMIKKNLEKSIMPVTALCPVIGYDNSAKIAKLVEKEGLSLKEAALESGLVTENEFDTIMDFHKMIHPGKKDES
ncbi:MAG: class II fumarate hydratase [Vulcanimicrobiota bacterium]